MSFDPVLIIGSGVCGLAIAQGLQKLDIPFLIFEAEDETFHPGDWTAGLDQSIPKLKSLLPTDISDRLETDAVVDPSLDYSQYPNNIISLFDGVNGELFNETTITTDNLRVNGTKLRALCHEGIEVRYAHTLWDIQWNESGNVVAVFSNGARHLGSVVIGADGPHSTVRERLFGLDKAEPTPDDALCASITFCYSDAHRAKFVRSANPLSSVAVHKDCVVSISIQDVPDTERPETWRFQVVVSWKRQRSKKNRPLSNEEMHQEVKEKVKELSEPFRSALMWIPEDLEFRYERLESWMPTPWHTRGGRQTLAGDAAHLMPSIAGQGLNTAITDAYNFVDAISGIFSKGWIQPAVIPSYSREVMARGAEEVQFSRELASLMLDYAKFKENCLTSYCLDGADTRRIQLDTLASTSASRDSSRRRKEKASKVRKAWSHAGVWLSDKIENLDRGAQEGMAQTSFVGVGYKAYGRRSFPAVYRWTGD